MGASSCDLCAHYVYDDEDDFDDNGNYRGSSSYTIEIKRK